MTTSADAPAPLTPPDCDLRGMPFMPLDVVRLGDSDLFALSTGDEFKAAVTLWCKSWLQVPAASLPNDDRILAHLSSTGPAWKGLRAMALRGWVLCSDGRLYHRVIAEKAQEAWRHRQAQRERAAKRWDKGGGKPQGPSRGDATARPTAHAAGYATAPADDATAHATASAGDATAYPAAHAAAMQGTGTGTVKKESPCTPPLADDAPPPASPPRKAADQGTRLPEDWQPGPAEMAFASSLGLDPGRVAARFRDFWHGKPGKDGRKSNWPGTWRNWCRKDAEGRTGGAASPPRQPGKSYAGCL